MTQVLHKGVPESGFSMAVLDQRTGSGWMAGASSPDRVGLYDRRSCLGIRTDWWDGRQWLKATHRGIECANQKLEWRERSE